jgi:hypothetical protein
MGKASSRKRATHQDPSTGRFEADSPLNDPSLRDYAIKTFRAIEHLEPCFQMMIKVGDVNEARLASMVGFLLSGMKENIRDQLSVDKAALRDATKPELRAARLYPALGITDAITAALPRPPAS